jgi:hypothetical protein
MKLLSFSVIASTQSIQIKTMLEERIEKHPQKAAAKRVLSDSSNRVKFSLNPHINYFALFI